MARTKGASHQPRPAPPPPPSPPPPPKVPRFALGTTGSQPSAPPRQRTKKATTTGPAYISRPSTSAEPATVSTKIRPPPLNFGNPALRTYLRDSNAIERYQTFKSRPFITMYGLSRSFLSTLHIDKLPELLDAQPMFDCVIDYSELIYPGMVGQFFANLDFKFNKNRSILCSSVNNVSFEFNSTKLNEIFGTTIENPATTLHFWDESHQWPFNTDKFSLKHLQSMFHTTTADAQYFNPTVLKPEDRVIYHLLHNFINPVAGHYTSPGKIPLVYYYLFTQKIVIDWGFIMHNRLADMVNDHRRNIPFAQFLTPIFCHFEVPFLEHGVSPSVFTLHTLTRKSLRFHNNHWITRDEYQLLGPPPIPSKPSSSRSPPLPRPPLSIQSLVQAIDTLTNHVRFLYHAVKMILSPEHHKEFESDKYGFGITSDTDIVDWSPSADTPASAPSSDAFSSGSGSPVIPADDTPFRLFKKPKRAP